MYHSKDEQKKDKFETRVINVRRVSKTAKGGRRMSFSALVVVGDRSGTVGFGLGKAAEVPEAVRKAEAQAKKSLINVPIEKNTIPFPILTKFGASKVMLSPSSEGKGIIAGSSVRIIVDLAGIVNITSKIQGSRNPQNVVKAVFKGFSEMLCRDEYLKIREA